MNEIDYAHAQDIVDRAATCLRPVKEAEILPAEAYTSETFWAFEKAAIFAREWLCVAHVNEIPQSGDHLPFTIAGEPIIVLRDDDTIRVLSGICQHRGHPIVGGVVRPPEPGRCLHARRLICPYHNWVYALDGRLVGAPSMDETTPVSELRHQVRLPTIRSEVFHGLIFINFDDDALPLRQSLAKLDDEFSKYRIADLIPGHVFEQKDLKWNWKLHHENALEPYHTDYVHKDYHTSVPSHLTRFREFDDDDGQIMRTTGFAAANGDLFEQSGERRLPDITGLSDEQRGRVFFVSIMPSVVAVLQPSFVTMTFLNPTAAGRMDSRRINLYSPAAAAAPDFDRIRQEQFDHMKIIIMQDQVTQAALQEAYGSRYAPRGRLSHLETAISQLNRWVVHRYRRALAAAGRRGT